MVELGVVARVVVVIEVPCTVTTVRFPLQIVVQAVAVHSSGGAMQQHIVAQ